jgi:endonuclease G, mitochondrial
MKTLIERLRAATANIEQQDPKLAEELKAVRARALERVSAEAATEAFESAGGGAVAAAEETIVLRAGRPVLAISNNESRLVFEEAESEIWRERLTGARDGINHAIRAVGRIDLVNHPRFDWVGTGWLVADDIIVTNRHVASEFANGNGKSFTFRSGILGQMSASIDFLHEVDSNQVNVFDIQQILHIEPDNGHDISFLRVQARDGQKLADPIALSRSAPAVSDQVAVIGYPAKDSRVPEPDLMERIFGNVFNRKRLAPGQIKALRSDDVLHDCSTLGGNSGSVVLSLNSGEAVGLHFSGTFLEANFAVPASVVADRLDEVRYKGTGAISTSVPASTKTRTNESEVQPSLQTAQSGELTFEVPLIISVRLGSTTPATTASASVTKLAQVPTPTIITTPAPPSTTERDEAIEEGRVEDYSGRKGYESNFLGNGHGIELPDIENQEDIVTFSEGTHEPAFVLRYNHFSVIMSASRRMCILSAVNINGKTSRKTKRGPWKWDPRIPHEAQIMKECYGDFPKFSRGHMTRREDPAWGTEAEAVAGNNDSMHVSNTVPQMQPFNAGIWLALENYALDNSREDDMKITVFTGPFFSKRDPMMYEVKIPTTFWKVIAFIHDKTGELCATGYTMSQSSYLQKEEFVFGQHETAQTSIREIEQRAGLDFGRLSSLDPFRRTTESFSTPLMDFSQIRFV